MKTVYSWIVMLLIFGGMNLSCSDRSSSVDIPTLERIIEQTDQSSEAGQHVVARALGDAQWWIGGRREAALAARLPPSKELRAIVEWCGGLTAHHHICVIGEKQVNYFSFDRTTHRVITERQLSPSLEMVARLSQEMERLKGYRGGERMIGIKDGYLLYVTLYQSGRLSTQFVIECPGAYSFTAASQPRMTAAWLWASSLQGDLARLVQASEPRRSD